MSNNLFAHSRPLPGRLRMALEQLMGVEAAQFGARNKTISRLLYLEMVEQVSRNHRHIIVRIADRGKRAVERESRGVDPFLIMTE